MKIYLACAIHGAPDEFGSFIKELKKTLRDTGHEVLDFYNDAFGIEKASTVSPTEVYNYDIDCIKRSDLVLAICDHPSLGVGIEIASATSLGKRVIAVVKEGSSVSKMVSGNTSENFSFLKYKDLTDIVEFID